MQAVQELPAKVLPARPARELPRALVPPAPTAWAEVSPVELSPPPTAEPIARTSDGDELLLVGWTGLTVGFIGAIAVLLALLGWI